MISAFWWRPRRDYRAFASELRHNKRAWYEARRSGGRLLENFGDELSQLVLREAVGTDVKWSPVRNADVIAIGSILELYLEREATGKIWGSGLRNVSPVVPNLATESVLAVRGVATREALQLGRDTVLGDPGLIARAIFKKNVRNSGKTFVLPHFRDLGSSEGRRLISAFRAAGVEVVPPSAPVRHVCTEIGAASHVITSSLHGLVVGHALGTPTTLAHFAATAEPQFKYSDYMSIYGRAASMADARHLLDPENRLQARSDAHEVCESISTTVDSTVQELMLAARSLR